MVMTMCVFPCADEKHLRKFETKRVRQVQWRQNLAHLYVEIRRYDRLVMAAVGRLGSTRFRVRSTQNVMLQTQKLRHYFDGRHKRVRTRYAMSHTAWEFRCDYHRRPKLKTISRYTLNACFPPSSPFPVFHFNGIHLILVLRAFHIFRIFCVCRISCRRDVTKTVNAESIQFRQCWRWNWLYWKCLEMAVMTVFAFRNAFILRSLFFFIPFSLAVIHAQNATGDFNLLSGVGR